MDEPIDPKTARSYRRFIKLLRGFDVPPLMINGLETDMAHAPGHVDGRLHGIRDYMLEVSLTRITRARGDDSKSTARKDMEVRMRQATKAINDWQWLVKETRDVNRLKRLLTVLRKEYGTI